MVQTVTIEFYMNIFSLSKLLPHSILCLCSETSSAIFDMIIIITINEHASTIIYVKTM